LGNSWRCWCRPLLGATVVFEPSANPTEIRRTIKRERATALIAVPRMLDGLRAGIWREIDSRGQGDWLRRAFESASGQKFLRRAWRFRGIHQQFGWKFWGVHLRWRGTFGGDRRIFPARRICGCAGLRNDRDGFADQLESSVFARRKEPSEKFCRGGNFALPEDGRNLVRGENVMVVIGNRERSGPRMIGSGCAPRYWGVG